MVVEKCFHSFLILFTIILLNNLFFASGKSVNPLNSFNDFRRTIKSAANLRELVYDKTLDWTLQNWLKKCHHSKHHEKDLKVHGKKYAMFVVYDKQLDRHVDQLFLHLAETGKAHFNSKTRVCTVKDYCKDYYMLVSAKTTSAACGYQKCKYKGKKVYYHACILGPKPKSFTDKSYPAYIKGKQCSKCGPKYKCVNKLCSYVKFGNVSSNMSPWSSSHLGVVAMSVVAILFRRGL